MRRRTNGRYARTTVTIPIKLKKKMDKFKRDVNWSSVAAMAFDAYCTRASHGEDISLRSLHERLKSIEKVMKDPLFRHFFERTQK